MRKKVKRYSIDFDALERVRVYEMEQIVKCLNDDSRNLSSFEIRNHFLDAIG